MDTGDHAIYTIIWSGPSYPMIHHTRNQWMNTFVRYVINVPRKTANIVQFCVGLEESAAPTRDAVTTQKQMSLAEVLTSYIVLP